MTDLKYLNGNRLKPHRAVFSLYKLHHQSLLWLIPVAHILSLHFPQNLRYAFPDFAS